MSLSKFEHVKVTGISTVVPEKEINIYDEAQYYDNNIKKIDRMRKMVGFWTRRVVDYDVTPSDLGIQAAEILIKEMNIDKSSIDALVYMCQKPDFQAPATSFYIHNKLGLSQQCAVFDVNQGCPAWIYGLWLSSQMIEAGTCKKVLLIAADTPSTGMDPADRISAPVFGDGGTATLIEWSDKKVESFYNIETVSKDYEAIMTPVSGQRCKFNLGKTEDYKLFHDLLTNPIETPFGNKLTVFNGYMDGIAVFNFTISVVPENIKELMKYASMKYNDFIGLCLHQANKQIIQAVGDAVGFEREKVPYAAFENYGNNTMCSIPTTINHVYSEEITEQSSKVICSGFGNGLACASVILELDHIYSSGIVNYKKPDDFMTREKYLDYWKNKLSGNNN